MMMARRASTSAVEAVTNLLTANQSSIETDTTGLAAGSDTSIARSTSHASHGTASLACTMTAASGSIGAGTPAGTSGRAVSPNTEFTAVADVRHTGASRSCFVALDWYTSAGALISSVAGTASSDTTSYVQRTLTATSPSNAAYARVRVQWTSALLNEVHHCDRFGLFAGTNTDWVLGTGS